MAAGVMHETSAATTGLVVRFVRARGGRDAVDALLDRAGVTASSDELCDPSRWFTYADRVRLLEAMVDVLGDEDAPFELGATAARSGLNPSVVLAVRAFGSPRQVFQQLPKAVTKFTTTSTMRVRSATATHATIDYELHEGYEHSRLDCRYAQGLLAAVPTVFGLPRATVEHPRCESDGYPVCTYEVTWHRRSRRPWRRRSAERTELRALREQLAALQSAASDLTGSDDLTVALERIVARAGAAVLAPAYLCVVSAPDGGAPLVHHAGLDPDAAATATATLRTGRPLPNAIVVPVATARRHHGHLAAIFPGGHAGAPGDRELLGAYARHAGAALDQLWAFEALRRDGSRSRSLLHLAHELAATDDAIEVADLVARALLDIVNCPRATVLRWDPASGELRAAATAGQKRDDEREALLAAGVRPDDTPELVEMLARRAPTVLDVTEVSPSLEALLVAVGVDRCVAVPLTAGDALLGIATVGWPAGTGPETVGDELIERLQGVAEQAAAALHNARLLEEVRHRSLHDTLTGLPNRFRFGSELDERLRAQRGRAATAVLYGDLDGFKPVNDEFGHAAGDELLRQVAARLRGAVRPGDLVARLSGDEFAIVVEVADVLAATGLAERVLEALATPYRVEGRDLRVTASIGIALHEGPGGDGDRLLRSADAAMYGAKQRGRNQVVTAGAVVPVTSVSLGDELAAAIADGQVRAHYQPVVEVAVEGCGPPAVGGVEALARWEHPRLGTLGPASFLALAEQRGLVVELDLAVLRDACRTHAAARTGGGDDGRHLAVNVSAVTLLDERLVVAVREARSSCALAPGQLILEVTENRSLVDLPGVVQRLTELRRMGVRISLDDFGTGYSTLTWLHGLPIDQIKIDRSFVAPLPGDTGAAALVRGVVALGRELSLEVVAEGVETPEQLAVLRAAGCRWVQGYLFGRPGPDLVAALGAPATASITDR